MTEAQQDAMKRAGDIVREHFDAGVIIVEAREDDGDMRETWWHGGLSCAIGLCRIATVRIENRISVILEDDKDAL